MNIPPQGRQTLKSVPAALFLALALTGVSIAPCYAQYGGYYTAGTETAPAYEAPRGEPQAAPAQTVPTQAMPLQTGINQAGQAGASRTIVVAGSIATAQLLNNLNSDVPGPVLADVTSGPFEGGRAIGTFTKNLIGENGYISVTFNQIVKDGVVYKVSATALDEKSTLTGLQSNVNHHYDSRFVLPAAADFVKGYSQALGTVGTQTITTAGGGVASSTPPPTPHQAVMQGFQASSGQVATQLQQDANVPVTVSLARGTAISLLFTQSVTTGNAGQ